jgi:phenylpropionate dioxygenase-like ring-hydroxylating dioxygenase large terminal subunit
MFLSDTHLPQVLRPEDYTSAEQFQREREHLFLPGWHFVGTFADLPRDGDFRTFELLDYPLIVWKRDGEYHTFLNVCPHRFSRISGADCGHAEENLQCQYHGWEFDSGGHTRKIPDATSFKPMTKGALALTKFRTETCGQLIFVNLTEDAPSLADYLGPGYEIGSRLCSPEKRLAATLDYEIEANWKCKVENSLESYHVDMVHPTTFGTAPEPEECAHEVQPGWSTYATWQKSPSRFDRAVDKLVHRIARVELDEEYKHYHYYPYIMFGKMRLFSWMEWTIPLTPNRTRVVGTFFCYRGSGGIKSRIFTRFLARWEKKFFEKLANEDNVALARMQRGLNSVCKPSEGLLSIREERIFHFQKYILGATSTQNPSSELPVTRVGV